MYPTPCSSDGVLEATSSMKQSRILPTRPAFVSLALRRSVLCQRWVMLFSRTRPFRIYSRES
jgi:hypothetical protein